MKKAIWIVAVVVMCIFVVSGMSFALPFYETTDTGDSIADAIFLPDGTHKVIGGLGIEEDFVDMYGFSWGGGAFNLNSKGTSFDSQLFLFNENGNGIQASDNYAGKKWAYIQLPGLAIGNYYFAITNFAYPFEDVNDDLLFDFDEFSGALLSQPSNPQASLAYWIPGSWGDDEETSDPSGGPYKVKFAEPKQCAAVPEPAVVILFGTGLAGLAAFRKKIRA